MAPSTPSASSSPEDIPRPRRPGWKRVLLALAVLVAVVLLAVLGLAAWLHLQVDAALPQLEGETAQAGLAAAVTIERDARGVPWIRGENRLDVAFATGFVHGQERFFQMDLSRRGAAGELAELLGRPLLRIDRQTRKHRFRDVARAAFADSDPDERRLVEAYAKGVNAGLAALDAKPFEYTLLLAEPAPWQPEDSLLVVLAMYLQLQDPNGFWERQYGLLHDALPAELFTFLAAQGNEWDAALDGGLLPQPEIPGPEAVDLRRGEASEAAAFFPGKEGETAPLHPGSNAWALAGAHVQGGGALIANDMHLGLAVPNTWYRLALEWRDAAGESRRMMGVTLPGIPAVVVGSNGHLAWGFTNAYVDTADVVLLEPDTDDPERYLTPDGPQPYGHHQEHIPLKGGESEALDVEWTIWGPVLGEDHRGRRWAYRWVAHQPEYLDLGLLELENAVTLEAAIEIFNKSGLPVQSVVLGDADGRVAWTYGGPIPRRFGPQGEDADGFHGRRPASWADGSRGWSGRLAPEEVPRVVDPESGRLWSANNRLVGGAELARVGDGGYAFGARAGRIRDLLQDVEQAAPEDMLAVQLDVGATYLERWRDLLTQILDGDENPRRAEMRRLAAAWDGRADAASVGYPMVFGFRWQVIERVLDPLAAPAKKLDPEFEYRYPPPSEGVAWALLEARPPHLLDPAYESWDALLLAAADAYLEIAAQRARPLAEQTRGSLNRARISHPLARGIPVLDRVFKLNMPPTPLPGGIHVPRVQTPGFGASERLAVIPGREDEGYFHMPAGQSGHPRSPHYRDGHAAWVKGEPTPFLPGAPVHTLTLSPAAN